MYFQVSDRISIAACRCAIHGIDRAIAAGEIEHAVNRDGRGLEADFAGQVERPGEAELAEFRC